MAKQDFDKEDGVWRTVGGRRIFIRNGQALSDAMKESGKFKTVKREDVVKGKLDVAKQDYDNPREYKGDTSDLEAKHKPTKELSSNSGQEKISNGIKVMRYGDDYIVLEKGANKGEFKTQKEAEDFAKGLDRKNTEEKTKNLKSDAEKAYKNGTDKNDFAMENAKHGIDTNESTKAYNESVEKHMKEMNKEIENKENERISKEKTELKENEYHFAGEELYGDDPHRYDDIIKSAEARKEKFKTDDSFKKEHHIGFGSFNKDGVPVYDNDIDYKGDFGWANLETLSNDDLTKALNTQSEEYNKANAEKVGDGRTRNGRMDRIFKNAKVGQYEQGMSKISEEMRKRDMPRYNIYDKRNPDIILISSPTKEMADRQIQEMYKTDISLQKEYGWKELPQYEFKVGKVDEYLNERKEEKTTNGTMNNMLQQKAYEKYLKEHPNSKMTFNEFKKMK